MSTLLIIITSLLLDTASTEAYLQGQYGQSTMPVAGVQDGGFSIRAHSIYDINAVSRVFGEAAYSWGQTEGNRWVENADYELLYPYLTCDTVGGGMRSEQYYFRGGYRMAKHHIMWHLALKYRALQSYRSIDPRPKNKVADLRIEGSIGYTHDQYTYSLMAQVGRYKQNNDISFYSELGDAMIFHLVQPDKDYARFAGAFKSSYYHGITAGGTLMMQPRQHGFLAGLDYHYLRITKELSTATSIPMADICTHDMGAQFGYAAPRWRVMAQGGYTWRRGTQYIYGEAANQYYNLLLKSSNYVENQWYIGALGSYDCILPIGHLTIRGDVQYLQKRPSTLFAGATTNALSLQFAQLASYLTASQAQAKLSVRYAFPIAGRYAWFVEPAATYTCYLPTTVAISHTASHRWMAILKTGICF